MIEKQHPLLRDRRVRAGASRPAWAARINTIMQTCFFAISGVLPRDEAIAHIKKSIEKTYGKRGPEVVRRNFEVVDQALAHLHEIPVPAAVDARRARRPPLVSERGARFRAEGHGGDAGRQGRPAAGERVSRSTARGRWRRRNGRSATSRSRSRSGTPKICIQCNQCALVCPHAAIRAKVYDETRARRRAADVQVDALQRATSSRASTFTIQVAPEDCTGCNLCVNVCPAKDRTNPKHKAIDMHPQAPLRDAERANYDFFLDLPEIDRDDDRPKSITRARSSSSRCSSTRAPAPGCGETPYLKLLTQLFGDRAAHRQRHRLLVDLRRQPADDAVHDEPRRPRARRGRTRCSRTTRSSASASGWRSTRTSAPRARLVQHLAPADRRRPGRRRCSTPTSRARPASRRSASASSRLRQAARAASKTAEARRLETLADYLVKKSVWLVGGDGWAYDIGYGGLDHVLANRRDVNILVLDTEVYSNTGGQQSKATPLGAAAKFAAAGQAGRQEGPRPAREHVRPRLRRAGRVRREDGADRAGVPRSGVLPRAVADHRLQPLHRARLRHGATARRSRSWRSTPASGRSTASIRGGFAKGEPPLHLDYGPPKAKVADYMRNESRFRMVERADPARYKAFVGESQAAAERRYAVYQQLAGITVPVIRARTARSRRLRTGRRSNGPQHDVSRDASAASAGRRRRDRSPTTSTTASALEDAGAAMLVLRSLYEEEITGEQMDAFFNVESHSESFAEAGSFAPEPADCRSGPDEYLEHLRRVKAARSAFR